MDENQPSKFNEDEDDDVEWEYYDT
jgi:hypothetical protein